MALAPMLHPPRRNTPVSPQTATVITPGRLPGGISLDPRHLADCPGRHGLLLLGKDFLCPLQPGAPEERPGSLSAHCRGAGPDERPAVATGVRAAPGRPGQAGLRIGRLGPLAGALGQALPPVAHHLPGRRPLLQLIKRRQPSSQRLPPPPAARTITGKARNRERASTSCAAPRTSRSTASKPKKSASFASCIKPCATSTDGRNGLQNRRQARFHA